MSHISLGRSAILVGILVSAIIGSAIGEDDLIERIEQSTIREGRKGGPSWFHPRGTLVPAAPQPVVLMTLQTIGGSDYFGPVHWSETADNGVTWSEPKPIPGLGRKKLPDGSEEGVCDVVPEYHPATKSVLAIGHNVFYRGGKLQTPQPSRWPVYVVRRPDGSWSEPQRLVWDDPRGKYIYSCNCAQRVTLPNGDLLIPMTYGADLKEARSVSTLLCSFDGSKIVVKQVGNQLRNKTGRGLLEPSVCAVGDRYFLTIRAEDNRGYVSTSDDGLQWSEPRAWSFDSGEVLTMSTTQQRWLAHSEALYLVYTRKTAENSNVFRWRAPLFVAQVDRDSLRLIKSTERTVFPLRGDGINEPKKVAYMGNFHPYAISSNESLVTVGENFPGNGFHGDLLQARIRWSKPNRLAGSPKDAGN